MYLILYGPSTSNLSPSRVRPKGVFKNRNQKPDLLKHYSGSCYQNQFFFFDIPVPEIQILVPEIGFYQIPAGIRFFQKVLIKVRYAL